MLLAEDQSSIRAVLREFLESKGYTILEARNGRQALELAEHHPSSIEVLVTDVIMPQIRGLELANRVTELHPNICVIFMSGYCEEWVGGKPIVGGQEPDPDPEAICPRGIGSENQGIAESEL